MSIYDDASLVMIPSGYKDDKLYSIKPTSGDGDFTFSRDGSGASPATRVNSAGLIEKGRENVLLQSNQFDTTWGPSSSISVTGGQSGYDGSSDAWLLKRVDTSARYINQNITLSNAVYSYSVYAKAESVDWLYMWSYNGTGSVNVYFDLANGLVGTQSGTIDANIESVGGGWYRCSMSYNNNIAAVRLYPAVADGSITGGISPAGIYIQDAQLEQGLVATAPAIETTTAPVSAGLLGDMPRLDYSGGATCPSLLLEPARTNLLPHSEFYGSGSGWNKIQSSVTINDATSPEGVDNAAKLLASAGTANHQVESPSHSIVSGAVTGSVFAKKGSVNFVRLRFSDLTTNVRGWFDLENGEVGTIDSGAVGSIVDMGNGWYKCILTATGNTNTTSANTLQIFVQESDAQTSWTADGDEYIHIYGAQVEQGSYPTSYIPTYGSATARAKDFFVMNLITNGITTAIQTEASLFLEFEKPNTGENVDLLRWRGSGILGRGFIYNTAAGFASDWGSSQQLNIGGGDNNKVVWRLNSLTSGTDFINGTKGIGSTGTAWSDIRELRFNAEGGGGVLKIKQIALFPTALTDAECISLTTI